MEHARSIDSYDDLPPLSILSDSAVLWRTSSQVVSFSGQSENCSVCCIDVAGSTRIAHEIGDPNRTSKYYEIFLNSMATIAENFGARVLKNVGDSLLYYFPKTSEKNRTQAALEEVLESAIVMIEARSILNKKLHEEGLPTISYRISLDYGALQIAKSYTSNIEDLFGSTLNLCTKINSKAQTNGIVIGHDMYELVKSFDAYTFAEAGEYLIDRSNSYKVYAVSSNKKRTIINPFRHNRRT